MSKARLTIGEIAERNAAGGGFFFSPATLEFFGDLPSAFKVAEGADGEVWIYRVTRPRNAPQGYQWRPEWRRVNLETGEIGTPHTIEGARAVPPGVRWARR